MNKYYFTAKLSLLMISLLSIWFQSKPSQASTLLFTSESSQELIPINIEMEFINRIAVYQDHSLEEIIKSKFIENNFLVVLEPSREHYNRETSIKLMASPIASVSPVTQLASNQLLSEIGNSLNKLSWNGDRKLHQNTAKTSTILILPQADDGNVYRNVYDFEISLTDGTDSNSSETQLLESPPIETNKSLPNIPNNLNYLPDIVAVPKVSVTNAVNYVNNPNNPIAELTQNKITTGQNLNLNATQDISQYLISINSPIKNNFSIPKTKEQEELENKLEQQQQQLEKQQEQLYKLLEKQREARQRRREQEARKLELKRQQELRKLQQMQARRQQEIQRSLSR